MHENPNKSPLSNQTFIQSYVHDTQDASTLIQKELILIQEEKNLLQQRIETMKSFVNDLPSSDPQYSMILTTIKMDQIELDELSSRKASLLQKIEQI